MDTFEGDPQSPSSLHRYVYGRSDPVNRIDPSGQFEQWGVAIGITLAVAAIAVIGVASYLRQGTPFGPLQGDVRSKLEHGYNSLYARLQGELPVTCDCFVKLGINQSTFTGYIGTYHAFYNGFTSNAPVAGTLEPNKSTIQDATTISHFFEMEGNDQTAATWPNHEWTTFFNPNKIPSQDLDVEALLFHEALHGILPFMGSDGDPYLQRTLMGPKGVHEDTSNISDYLKTTCILGEVY